LAICCERGGIHVEKNFLAITTFAILLFVAFLIFYNGNKPLNGNDIESIEKVITLEGFEDSSIEILEIKDFDEIRVVAFLSNNNPGYIQFEKNEDGNYIKNFVEVKNDATLGSFSPTIPVLLLVTNYENEIAEMQVTINGETLEQNFTPNDATVAWIDLPKDVSDKYTFRNYKYFDKDGTLIKEFN